MCEHWAVLGCVLPGAGLGWAPLEKLHVLQFLQNLQFLSWEGRGVQLVATEGWQRQLSAPDAVFPGCR